MFCATYLGHHGWLFSSADSTLLVDPVLHSGFGHTESVELRIYPPREFDFAQLPGIDAVFLTHEHEGHFDLPSLHLLDRRIPIYMSARSSLAMRKVLNEMGFRLHLLQPGIPVDIGAGGLRLLPMTADQVRHGLIEEWDVLPYLVWAANGDGSLFTNVDMHADESMWQLARTWVSTPGLWAYTNNHSQWNFQTSWLQNERNGLREWAGGAVAYVEQLGRNWASPPALLVVGGGWCYGGPQAWLNHNVFPFSPGEAVTVLRMLCPEQHVQAPIPGDTFVMQDGQLMEVRAAPFVRVPPSSQWPCRQYRAEVGWLESYQPACGRTELAAAELPALTAELDLLAAHLYARADFRRLYTLSAADHGECRPTFALALLADAAGGAWVFAYEPQGCRFVPVESTDPASEYLAVYECWATDLLAFLRAELSVTSLAFGRSREWAARPQAFALNFNVVLFEHAHPLRFPERYLALYRSTVARLPPCPPRVFAAAHPAGAGGEKEFQ